MGDSAARREFWHQLGTGLGSGGPWLTCLRRSAAEFAEVKIVEGGERLGIRDRAALMVAEFAAECPDCVAWRGQG